MFMVHSLYLSSGKSTRLDTAVKISFCTLSLQQQEEEKIQKIY